MTAASSKTKKWVSRLKNRISLRSGNSSRQGRQSVPINLDPPALQDTARIAPSPQRSSTSLALNPQQEEPAVASLNTTLAPIFTDSRQVEPDSDTRDVSTTPNPLSASEIEAVLVAHGFRRTNNRPAPSTLYAALAWAAGMGNTSLITALLSHGASVLPIDGDHESYWDNFEWAADKISSPLHRAIEQRHSQTAELLLASFLQYGQDARLKSSDITRLMEIQDFNGKTLLSMAAEKGELQLAARFLDMGAHLEQCDKLGRTPLHQAARCGKIAFARWLLDRGADTTAQDNVGRTALDRAIAGRHHDVAAVLRKHIRSNLPFSGQAATGVHGMMLVDHSGDVATETKLGTTEEDTESLGEDVEYAMSKERRRSKQYRVEVITIAVAQKEFDAEDWDEPMSITRYNALLLPSQDEVAQERIIPGKVEGDEPPPMSTDWDEPFQAVRYGVGIEKEASKPVLEASAITDSDQWDEPFSAVSYRLTRHNDGIGIDITQNERPPRSGVSSVTPANRPQETHGSESPTIPNMSHGARPPTKNLSVNSRARTRAPLRQRTADGPTPMDILRWD